MTPEFKALADAVGRLRDIETAITHARRIPQLELIRMAEQRRAQCAA